MVAPTITSNLLEAVENTEKPLQEPAATGGSASLGEAQRGNQFGRLAIVQITLAPPRAEQRLLAELWIETLPTTL